MGVLIGVAALVLSAPNVMLGVNIVAAETDGSGGFNFDGYGGGAMRITVPLGWTVDVLCKNDSTTMAHSCAFVDDAPLTPFGGTIAFSGASTPNPVNGLGLGESSSFQFVASKVGTYRIACLVIGHESDGMWDWLDVTPGGSPRSIPDDVPWPGNGREDEDGNAESTILVRPEPPSNDESPFEAARASSADERNQIKCSIASP